MGKFFAYTFTAALSFSAVLIAAEERSWESKLSPAGKTVLKLHDQLWNELVPKYETKVQKQANTQIDNLLRLSFAKEERALNGETEILIPEDLQAQAPKFAVVELIGTGLEGVDKVFFKLANGAKIQANIFSSSNEKLTLGTRELRTNDPAGPEWSLVLEGEGKLTQIDYFSSGGVTAKFNHVFYLPPGSKRPLKNVTVSINPTTEQFYEGISEFQKDRYFRLYLEPNWDKSGYEKQLAEKGFVAGRQQTEIRDRVEWAYGLPGFELMKESPDHPHGYDPGYFERNNFGRYSEVPKDFEFCMCFNIWPSFMNVDVPGVKNDRGTPKDFDAAGAIAADYIKAQKRDSGRTATWWEVKNEADIQTEWSYHWVKGYDGWQLLADFHNKVADKVKEVAPEVKVGGPASAWFHPEKHNFRHWADQKKFMDDTKDHLDFYSHHFYERTWLDTYDALWTGYDDFMHGKLDCTLDMLQAHMRATDNKKPLVVSEYGSLLEGDTDQDCWVRVKNLNHLMIDFMHRPAELDLTVPFIIPFMHWDPTSGWAMISKNADGSYKRNKNGYFIDFWQGFEGTRVAIDDSEHKLITHAVRKGDKVVAVLSNRTGHPLNVNLELEGLWTKRVSSLKAKRIFFKDRVLQFEEKAVDPSSIFVGVEECCMITMEMPLLDPWKQELREVPYFAKETALEFGPDKDAQLSLVLPEVPKDAKATKAFARIGLYRNGGFSDTIRIQLNGYDHQKDLSYSKGIKTFFDWIEIPIPLEQLRENNTFVVSGPEDGRLGSAKIVLATTLPKKPVPKPVDERTYPYPR